MGVRGLQSFAEHNCPDVCHTVSIEQLAVDYRRRHPNTHPTIVVDGMSLLNRLYCQTLEWVYGGQWVQFCAILDDFVKRFQRIGVKLVFFFDGTVEPKKRSEWVTRRQKRMRIIQTVFDFIKIHHKEPSIEDFQLPASMGTLVRFVFKCHLGTEVYSTTREADIVIAEYANSHEDTFAILGQDSDFMIFDTKPYLSAVHLDLDRMTTILYDRRTLARNLSLTVPALPLFSCIMGNDIIPFEMVHPFHRMLCEQGGQRNTSAAVLAPLVGSLINSNGWTGNTDDQDELAAIATIALGDARNSLLLRDALLCYKLKASDTRRSASMLVEKHVQCEVSPALYNILRNLEYESSELMEDCNKEDGLPPAALIFRPVRRRIYSILFAQRPEVVVKEWCAFWGNAMEAPELVVPEPLPTRKRYSLGELWSNIPEFQEARYECYLHCLGSTLQLRDLKLIPKRYVVPVCILNYLLTFNPPLLHSWEVTAFLVQAVSISSTKVHTLYNMNGPCVEARAVNLASIFMRGVAVVVMLLGACGYPFALKDAMPWNFFDGKLFHSIYMQAARNSKLASLCKTRDDVLEVNHLFSIATSGTALQGTSLQKCQ